jgi:hypothetical protein
VLQETSEEEEEEVEVAAHGAARGDRAAGDRRPGAKSRQERLRLRRAVGRLGLLSDSSPEEDEGGAHTAHTAQVQAAARRRATSPFHFHAAPTPAAAAAAAAAPTAGASLRRRAHGGAAPPPVDLRGRLRMISSSLFRVSSDEEEKEEEAGEGEGEGEKGEQGRRAVERGGQREAGAGPGGGPGASLRGAAALRGYAAAPQPVSKSFRDRVLALHSGRV